MAAQSVAVVDDDPVTRQLLAMHLEGLGFIPHVLTPSSPPYKNVEQLWQDVANVDYVLCDHKLRYRNYADFEGAEAVSSLYLKRKPAILITQYTTPEHMNILKLRPTIPYVIERDSMEETDFRKIFNSCKAELEGNPSSERKKHRTLIQIDSVKKPLGSLGSLSSLGSANSEAIAFIPTWKKEKAIILPFSIVPKNLHREIKAGNYLIANVNIGAHSENDLFFSDFEKAPLPIAEDEIESVNNT